MNRQTVKWAVAVMLALVPFGALLAQPAQAFSFLEPYSGPIIIKIADFTDSALYSWSGSAVSCGSVGACDGLSQTAPTMGFNSDGTFGTPTPPATREEDSWGIFKVTSIHKDNLAQTTLWFDSKDGEELTGIFWGIQDSFVDIGTDGKGVIRSIGTPTTSGVVKFAVYLGSSSGATAFDATGGPTARTGLGTYPTVSDGTLWLTLDTVAGATADATGVHLNAQIDVSGTFTGNGTGFAEVTGGSNAGFFVAGAFTTFDGLLADVKLLFDTDAAAATNGWTTFSNDPIRAVVAEPAALLLLGAAAVAMAGLGIARRRKA